MTLLLLKALLFFHQPSFSLEPFDEIPPTTSGPYAYEVCDSIAPQKETQLTIDCPAAAIPSILATRAQLEAIVRKWNEKCASWNSRSREAGKKFENGPKEQSEDPVAWEQAEKKRQIEIMSRQRSMTPTARAKDQEAVSAENNRIMASNLREISAIAKTLHAEIQPMVPEMVGPFAGIKTKKTIQAGDCKASESISNLAGGMSRIGKRAEFRARYFVDLYEKQLTMYEPK